LSKRINFAHLKTIIDRFSQGKVLVLGDLMLDSFLPGRVERISPEAPVPVAKVKDHDRKLFLGGAANVAYNIESLGGKTFLSGVIGNDREGDDFLKLVTKLGLDSQGLVVEKKRPTTHKLRVIAQSQQVMRLDRETDANIKLQTRAKIGEFIKENISKVGCIVISDYAKGVITLELLKEISSFPRNNIPLLGDPCTKNIKFYHNFNLLKPNLKETREILNREIGTELEIKEAAYQLKERTNSDSILITCGDKGMALLERNKFSRIPSLAKEVFDVTGAGDTVIGIIALALSVGATLKEATQLANFAAGIVISKLGTAIVSKEELLQLVDSG